MLIKADIAVLVLIVLAVIGFFVLRRVQRRERERLVKTAGHRALRRLD